MEADRSEIDRKLRKVSDLIEEQMQHAIQALLTDDVDLASGVILGDRQINRRVKELDYLCHAFIVRHAPSGGHLRFVSAVLRLNVALERVGDYASTIGREVVHLSKPPAPVVARDIELIAKQARRIFRKSLQAFHTRDVALARETYGLADLTDVTLNAVFDALLEAGEAREISLSDAYALLRIVNLIKRVSEQSENVCEQTIFAVTGDRRDPKVFRILFVGERNDRASIIAEAYARKAFPESGTYRSAGPTPAEAVSPELVSFLDEKGVDVRGVVPTSLESALEEPLHFHVIVVVSPGIRERLRDAPFRSVVLEWEMPGGDGMDEASLDALYRELVVKVQDLMLTLAGPDAR
jgi:phosphate transport system protein